MSGRRFQRRIEDFACEHCGAAVTGTGFTNHCPQCLWSRHVDIHPGDRQHTCRGLMKPVSVEVHSRESILIHRCQICGETRRNKVAEGDNFDAILAIMRANT